MLGNKGTGREYRDGGCRGGQDQFKWDDVKADAYRENYLGHSLNAPVGRWQKGKDILWYTKKHGEAKEHVTTQLKRPEGGEAARRAEILRVKQEEEEYMAQALGLAVKKRRIGGQQLDELEVNALLARGMSTREGTDVERVEGLGAAPAKRHEHIPKLSLLDQELARRESAAQAERLTVSDGGHYGPGPDVERQEMSKKDLKKEKKREKKEKKREKKERKREKKEAKLSRKKGGRESSSGSD